MHVSIPLLYALQLPMVKSVEGGLVLSSYSLKVLSVPCSRRSAVSAAAAAGKRHET